MSDYDLAWAREVAGPRGIGNYPASREALVWCLGQLEIALDLLARGWGRDDAPKSDFELLESLFAATGSGP